MKRIDKVLNKILVYLALFLFIMLIVYFFTVQKAFDGTFNHTYFPASILVFCVIGLVGFFMQKTKIGN
jgi:nucleoside recognition membrane protein YjiH